MNEIMNFQFEHTDVECITLNNEPLFNPYNIGKALEMPESTVRNHLTKMNEKQKILLKNPTVHLEDSRKFHNTGENFLTESGVYKLIFKSRAPKAEQFQDWITDEVLPQIRKSGRYELESQNSVTRELLANMTETLRKLTGVQPEELARIQNESYRAKLANLLNDIAKRDQISTKVLYEKMYFLFAGETGFHIPELAAKSKLSNSAYLKQHELSAKMLYEFALAYFYQDKMLVELINLHPDQKALTEF